MKRKLFLIFFAALLQVGMSVSPTAGSNLSQDLRVSLSKTHQESRFHFLEKYANPTEGHKIRYLLNMVRNSDWIFIRNGKQYPGKKAFKWLQWKMHHRQYENNPIRTAADFVHRVCDASRKSGQPYRIMLSDGEIVRLAEVLEYELAQLESALRRVRPNVTPQTVAPSISPVISPSA